MLKLERVEAVLFAAPAPMMRDALARVFGPDLRVEALIEDISEEWYARSYKIVLVAAAGAFRGPVNSRRSSARPSAHCQRRR
jgi:segregation and condensation protein B